MTKNEMGGQLQNLLIDTIAKYSALKVVEDVMPLIRKRCVVIISLKVLEAI